VLLGTTDARGAGFYKGKQVVVDFTFKVPLQHGVYLITADARVASEDLYLDRVEAPTRFRITRPSDRNPYRGVVHLPTEIKVHSPEHTSQPPPAYLPPRSRSKNSCSPPPRTNH
jgi:hypothetical protein